jgi:serine/threonine protein kinase
MTLVAGTTFAGRYQVLRRIAEGGMGAVYEVIHVETGRRRALKVLHPHVLKDRKAREQFRREARIGGVIEAEAVVDVFDAGIDEASSTPFLVMELLRGEDLNRLVERGGPLAGAEVVAHLRQASFALDKAHRAGVVHRDLKPDNLFLHRRDQGAAQLKILDFGVAKIIRDANQLTGDTLSVGTPMFMAPEQFTGSHAVTAAADRYALGHVAYALLVGEPYFDPEAEQETALLGFMRRVVEGPREPPSARALARRGVKLPEAFDRWFLRATNVDPDKRHPSAGALVDHLETSLGLSMGGTPTRVVYRGGVDDGPVVHTPEPLLGASDLGTGSSSSDPFVTSPLSGASLADALVESVPRYNTISGTTTPHRPQRTRANLTLALLGTLTAGLAIGLGAWFFGGRVADMTPGEMPARSAAADLAATGAPAAPDADRVLVEPSEPAAPPAAPSTAAPSTATSPSARPSASPSSSASAPPAGPPRGGPGVPTPPRGARPAPPPSTAAPTAPTPPRYTRD